MYKHLQELISQYVVTYSEEREQLRQQVVAEIDKLIELTKVTEDDEYIINTRQLKPRVTRFYFIRRLLQRGYHIKNKHKGTYSKQIDADVDF